MRLETRRSLLLDLLVGELEVLAALDHNLVDLLARRALELEGDLLGGLGLLLEDGLGLSTETFLLPIVTALSLCCNVLLASLVLHNLVFGVLLAL